MDLLFIWIIEIFVIIGIPILISILLYKYLKWKFDSKWIRFVALIPILIMTYLVYTAFYPLDEFYEENFKELTKLNFPLDAEIESASASYPDQFGDYTSVFAVKTSKKSYNNIFNQIRKVGYQIKSEKWNAKEIDIALKKSKSDIKFEYSKIENGGKLYYAAFLKDNQTIIFSRVSW